MKVHHLAGNRFMDAENYEKIVSDPQKYLKATAEFLCDNRWAYQFSQQSEDEVLASVKDKDILEELIREVVEILHSENGDTRVGAAELLGVITPSYLCQKVVPELKKRLNDNYIRNCVTYGRQGDEEDMRTVKGCAQESIEQLDKKNPLAK